MYKLSKQSLQKLEGVNPSLVKVVTRALELSTVDFCVTEGLRSVERQEMLVKAGKSQTMRSKHLEGRAVDLAAMPDGKISWDWRYYEELNRVMQQASKELDIPIVWGGSWTTFKDGVHFQLGE